MNVLTPYMQVPYGKSVAKFTLEQRTGGLGAFPTAIQEQIKNRYPEHQYWSMELSNQDKKALVVTRPAETPCLVWEKCSSQEGQQEPFIVEDYYIYNKSSDELISIFDVLQIFCNLKVSFSLFLYNPRYAADKTEQVIQTDTNHFVIFVHRPLTLGDVSALFHELGHIVALCSKNNVLARNCRDNKETEIKAEIEAWLAAIELIKKAGLGEILGIADHNFAHYIWHCIKTRIPKES